MIDPEKHEEFGVAQPDDIAPSDEKGTAADQKDTLPQDENTEPAKQTKKARKKARKEAAAAEQAEKDALAAQPKKARKKARKEAVAAAAAAELEEPLYSHNGIATAGQGDVIPQSENFPNSKRAKKARQQEIVAASQQRDNQNVRGSGTGQSSRCWIVTVLILRFIQFGVAASILGIVAHTIKLVISHGWPIYAWEILAIVSASVTIIGIPCMEIRKMYSDSVYNIWISLVLEITLFVLWVISAAFASQFENACGDYCNLVPGSGGHGRHGIRKRLPSQNIVRNWWAQATTGLCILEMLLMLLTLLPLAYVIFTSRTKLNIRGAVSGSPFRNTGFAGQRNMGGRVAAVGEV